MATKESLGQINKMTKSAKQSHLWARTMNENLIRLSMGISAAVISRVADLDTIVGPAEGDTYLDLTDGSICTWLDAFDDGVAAEPAKWWYVLPAHGMLLTVASERKVYLFTNDNGWEVVLDLDAAPNPVQRNFAFFAPGPLRPNAVIFRYVAGMPLAFEEGAPGSGASLLTAPSSDLVLTLQGTGGQWGTITFLAGQTDGVVDIPARYVIHNGLPAEWQYVQAQHLEIRSPANTFGAQGLNVTLRGEIWERD